MKQVPTTSSNVRLYRERYRPQLHFTPPKNWINDPNGLIYYDGVYHLFYQHNPHDNVWGDIHWGHATSRDLVKWEHQSLALHPDPEGLGIVASGCAVLDTDNTAGFQTGDHPVMVAVFSHFPQDGRQVQSLAYSNDLGSTWTMYASNPVLEGPLKDFRDPKVFWHADTQRWVMVLAVNDHVRFYTAPDLKQWTHRQSFGADVGAHDGVWECPDLFELPVDGSSDTRWVLIVSVQDGAPNRGSGTQYFVGTFDGTAFHIDDGTYPQWLDFGPDNYASISWSGLPAGRRTMIGWMNNWRYAERVPTTVWRGTMTLPRSVKLRRHENRLLLMNQPSDALIALREAPVMANLGETLLPSSTVEIAARFIGNGDPSTAGTLILRSSAKDELRMSWDLTSRRLLIDRSLAVGDSGFLAEPIELPAYWTAEGLALTVLLDHSSVEVFVNGGLACATALIFPTMPLDRLILDASNTFGASATIYPLRSIWP